MSASQPNAPRPPRWAAQLLAWLHPSNTLEEVEGDLEELYRYWYRRAGKRQAQFRYVFSVLSVLPPFVRRRAKRNSDPQPSFLHSTMLRNYFKIAFRNLARHQEYTLLNVMGLTMGLAAAILIFTMVKYHLSFDAFHANRDRIFRIFTEFHDDKIRYNVGVPSPLAEALRNEYTVAEKVARVAFLSKQVVGVTAEKKFEEDIAFAEPAFFDIVNFPLVRGNPPSLGERNTAMITERMAEKYFGAADPLGKTIRIADSLRFTITGLLQDLPPNTDFRPEIYLPFSNLKDHSPWLVEENWWLSVNKGMQCFVRLKPGVSAASVDKKVLAAISSKFYDKKMAQVFRFKLQPLSDMHFNANLRGYIEKKNLWALAIVGLFLIVTTCVNFINLATAQALGRSKEIDIRKVLGSRQMQLFWQFMAETAVIVGLAMAGAFVLAHLSLPAVNQLFDTSLRLNPLQDEYLLAFLPVLLLTVVFLSGSYPGIILAGFHPVLALKGKLSQRQVGGFSLRKGLVVTQFAISQLLIIGTLVIANQVRYSQQADLGFRKEAIVMLPVPDNQPSRISTLRSQLSQLADVEKVTFCNAAPASEIIPNTGIQFDSRTEGETFSIYLKAGDHQYVPTFGLQILAGRNLYPSDTVREYLLNETAVKKLQVASYQDVLGKNAIINGRKGTIVGVVKNFHNQSFHAAIEPVYITTQGDNYFSCAVKVNLANLGPTMSSLEKAWKEVYPSRIFKYSFLEEEIARFYRQDHMILVLIQAFAGIAIVISCLGLYGLVSFMAAQKTKEVGVRKVLGASVPSILWLFSKEFARLLVMAFVLAAPLGWWVMNHWLDNFVYRIEMGAGIFALSFLMTLVVAMLTVGYRSMKAAVANPVQSLRTE